MKGRTNEVKELAALILERRGGTDGRQKPNLTSPSTASGSTVDDAKRDGLPLPIGTEGQILTVVDAGGGLLVPEWEDPAPVGGPGSHYQQYVTEFDGSGGWTFVGVVIDGQEYPVAALLITE